MNVQLTQFPHIYALNNPRRVDETLKSIKQSIFVYIYLFLSIYQYWKQCARENKRERAKEKLFYNI